jgi:hypothetical protein
VLSGQRGFILNGKASVLVIGLNLSSLKSRDQQKDDLP